LNGPASSRASSLPQCFCLPTDLAYTHNDIPKKKSSQDKQAGR
jgi:hypothetical protein